MANAFSKIVQKAKNLSGSLSNFLPLSMKSMTANEWLFKVLELPPSWLDVCRQESSFDTTEPSPSLHLFDLLLFFFEDMFNSRIEINPPHVKGGTRKHRAARFTSW